MKGDALYAGKLVFVYLLCGAIGTMIGAPLADRWGHRRFLRLTMLFATATLPLMFFVKGYMLFFVLGFQGMLLISTFAVTVVMAQKLLPARLGIASGLMVGFAIGTGGIGVTALGIVADNFGVPVALESIMVLPFIGLIFSLMLRYRERV
jgi:FSR family fosmidomycin resistance protein-like MFS transporter